jgi:FkbM family methyltransferase
MSDSYSRNLFTELLVMMMLGEKKFRLSSFDATFASAYEKSSEEILNSKESLNVYTWVLKKVISEKPKFSVFTTPVFLALLRQHRLYSYSSNDVSVDACEGDTVIEGGIGWGDTTMYLASKVTNSGRVYSFDVLDEGIEALREQLHINPQLENVTPVLNALSDVDGETVYITSPSPGARISESSTNRSVETVSIDNYVGAKSLMSVDFIKMDIEGAEVPALNGARNTIKKFKPKLAISVYHKWDDLREIPKLIHGIRDDYEFYLDCTTGFGGEAVLYCR